jgi:hypothetical protein
MCGAPDNCAAQMSLTLTLSPYWAREFWSIAARRSLRYGRDDRRGGSGKFGMRKRGDWWRELEARASSLPFTVGPSPAARRRASASPCQVEANPSLRGDPSAAVGTTEGGGRAGEIWNGKRGEIGGASWRLAHHRCHLLLDPLPTHQRCVGLSLSGRGYLEGAAGEDG